MKLPLWPVPVSHRDKEEAHRRQDTTYAAAGNIRGMNAKLPQGMHYDGSAGKRANCQAQVRTTTAAEPWSMHGAWYQSRSQGGAKLGDDVPMQVFLLLVLLIFGWKKKRMCEEPRIYASPH